MLEIKDVDYLAKRYIVQSITTVALLTGIACGIALLVPIYSIIKPVTVGIVFSLVVEIADGIVWWRVAKKSPDSLPTFYTAVSGFRMLLALFTLFVCYLVVGRDAMLEYCIVFLAYYFVMLAHHSVYFSHVSNSHSKCDKEK